MTSFTRPVGDEKDDDEYLWHFCPSHLLSFNLREGIKHTLIRNSLSNAEPDINQSALSYFLTLLSFDPCVILFQWLKKVDDGQMCASANPSKHTHRHTQIHTHMHKKKTEQYSILASIKCWVVTFFSDLKLNLFRIKEYRIKYFILRIKVIQVYNNTRVSKWWQNYNFCVNFPFKVKSWLTFCVYWHIWTQKDRYAWIRG